MFSALCHSGPEVTGRWLRSADHHNNISHSLPVYESSSSFSGFGVCSQLIPLTLLKLASHSGLFWLGPFTAGLWILPPVFRFWQFWPRSAVLFDQCSGLWLLDQLHSAPELQLFIPSIYQLMYVQLFWYRDSFQVAAVAAHLSSHVVSSFMLWVTFVPYGSFKNT